ncbi:MAG: hypothetical protein MJ237_05740, partial [bacterium]|nr:hypothetical protein [bacterium]
IGSPTSDNKPVNNINIGSLTSDNKPVDNINIGSPTSDNKPVNGVESQQTPPDYATRNIRCNPNTLARIANINCEITPKEVCDAVHAQNINYFA